MTKLVDRRALPIFIHSEIDDMTSVSPNAMRVYMHLARRADKSGKAWPSYQSIGDHCFSSISQTSATRKTFARNAIEELVKAGLIVKEQRRRDDGGQTSNAYVLVNPTKSTEVGGTSIEPDPMPIKHGGVSNKHGSVLNRHGPCLISTEDTPLEDTPLEDDSYGANAPAQDAPASAASLASQFRNFHDELKTSTNRIAVLRRAYVHCYGEQDAPDFGRIGAFAKRVGGAGMALELIWSVLSRPPNGNVIDYLEATFSARKQRRQDGGKGQSKVAGSMAAVDRLFSRLEEAQNDNSTDSEATVRILPARAS